MKLCRICLSCHGRLYCMSKSGLEPMFQALTGISFDEDKRLPQSVCAECGLLLMSYNRLRERSIKSHQILCDLLRRFDSNIEDVNWSSVAQVTRLTQSSIAVNEYNPNIDGSGFLTSNEPTKIKIKDELETLFMETENDRKVKQNDINYQEESQNDFDIATCNDRDENSSNDEISLSKIVLMQKVKPKITKTKYKCKKSSHKQEVKKRKHNNKQNDPEITTDHKQIDKKVICSEQSNETKEVNQDTDKRFKKFPFESMYTVIVMDNEQLKDEVLERQFSSNYKNAAFKCSDCFKGFCDKGTYERHRLKHSQDWGSLVCDICKNHYPCKPSLSRHFIRMHTFRYNCKNCVYVASTRGLAMRHALKHMGKKYQCKHCEMEYVNYTTYLNHLRKSHNSEYICELCGFSFVSALGVLHHKKLKHRFDDPNMVMVGPHCASCDIKFATKEAYDNHFKSSAKHLVKAYDVKQKRLNQGIKQPTFCEQCDVKLDSQSAYFKHFKMFHPNKKRTRAIYSYSFMCEECGGIFKSNIALQEHRRIHTKEKPFACAQCGRAFTQKIALKNHETIHDENRTLYPCHLCDKKFTNKNNLRRHVFLHTGARPFECESCGKTFKTKSEKRSHFDYVHLKKPWPKRDRNRRVVSSASGTDIQ